MAELFELRGSRVLVLEDSYYLAWDVARALKAAGAEVIGPCPTEEAAFGAIARDPPTCGILDINLGAGPSFEIARELARRDIPFLFVTGHGNAVIPREFADVPHVQKPVDPHRVVEALSGMLAGRRGSSAERAIPTDADSA